MWAQCNESPESGRAMRRHGCSCACSVSMKLHAARLEAEFGAELTQSILRIQGLTAPVGGVARRQGSGEDLMNLRKARKGCAWGIVSCCP